MSTRPQLPEPYRSDLRRAVEILKGRGCTEVYLYGSLAAGEVREDSDMDLAIRGCPPGEFFVLLGQLLLALNRPVDLVSLDRGDPFGRYLESAGELVRVA